MAKTLKIPVSLYTTQADLQNIITQLQVITQSTSKAVTTGAKGQADSMINTIKSALDQFSKASGKGKMSTEMMKGFQSAFEKVAIMSKGVIRDIDDDLKKVDLSTWPDVAKNQYIALDKAIDDAQKAMIKLNANHAKTPKKFSEMNFGKDAAGQPIDASAVRKQFSLGNLQDFGLVETKLKSINEEYKLLLDKEKAAAKGKDKISSAEMARLTTLKSEKKVRDDLLKNVQAAMGADAKYKTEMEAQQKTERDGIESKKALVKAQTDSLTATERSALALAKDSAAKAENASKSSLLLQQIRTLGGGFNIFGSIINGAKDRMFQFAQGIISGTIIFNTMKRVFRQTITTIKDLDKAFNEIAMVTTYTTQEAWKMKEAFTGIASATGQTITEIAKLSVEFFRQGRSYSEVLKLTEAAAMAARIAGISTSDSVTYLTSAINGYQLSASQAMVVSDKFAALAASSATSYEELAIALSKVAAQAYSAGVNMDNMMGFIAKAIETTREAPENIGTAFKTIFARMSELKDFGKTFEDGMDVSRVDTALKTIGVSLTDQKNELRNLDEVLIEVGYQWSGLNKNQKAYIATALAGTRQQTRLLAVMEDFERTMELTEISANSLGASLAQQNKYTNTIAFAMNGLIVAWQSFISSLTDSKAIIFFIDILSSTLEVVNSLIKSFTGLEGVLLSLGLVLAAISSKLLITSYANGTLTLSTALLRLGFNQATVAGLTFSGLLDKITFATLKTIISQNILAKTIVGTVGALKSLVVFMLTPGPGLFLTAILGLGAAFIWMATATERAKRKAKDFIEATKKAQAEVYNLRKKASDLETLVDKYDEINKSIIKTNADLEEQKGLLQQIQDIIGEKFNVSDNSGNLNLRLIEAEIAGLYKESEKIFTDAVENGEKLYGRLDRAFAASFNDASTRQFLIIGKALKDNALTYQELLESKVEERDLMLEISEIELELGDEVSKNAQTRLKYQFQYVDAVKGVQNVYFDTLEEIEEARKKLGLGPDGGTVFEQKAAPTTLADQAKDFYKILEATKFFSNEITKGDKALSLNEFFKLDVETQNTIKATNIDINNLVSLVDRLGNITPEALSSILGVTPMSIEQLATFSKTIDELGFLNAAEKAEILKDTIHLGPEAALDNFAASGKGNLLDIINLSQTLIDTLSSVDFEDLQYSAKGLNSTFESLNSVNEMLSGNIEYDILKMQSLLELYPALNDMIKDGNQLSQEQISQLAELKRKEFEEELNRKEAEIRLTIDNNNLELAMLEDMLNGEVDLEALAQQARRGQESNYLVTLKDLQNAYLVGRTKDDVLANRKALRAKLQDELKTANDLDKALIQARINALGSDSSNFNLTNLGLTTGTTTSVDSMQKMITDRIATIISDNSRLQQQLTNIENVRRRLAESGNLLGNSSKNSKEAKEYEAQLNEIYNLLQAIAYYENELSKFDFMREHAEDGEEFVEALRGANLVYEYLNTTLDDLNAAYARQQQLLLGSLGTAQKAVIIRNGRMIANLTEYNKLTGAQKELVDGVVESYNEYTDNINDNSNAVKENTAAIEENNKVIEEKTIELYEMLLEAIRNTEKEKLEILKKGIEAERKLLDKRRQMYNDAFKEEDYTNSLEETNKRRQEIIQELSTLEGATDLNSAKRREELLEEKAGLDKEYNTQVRDYNREALLNSIDDQEKALDTQEQAYEDYYNKVINDMEFLQSEIDRIMEGGLDNVVTYLTNNHPDYENQLALVRNNLQAEWTMLADIVITALDEISAHIPDVEQFVPALPGTGTTSPGDTPPGGTPTSPTPANPVVPKAPTVTTKTIWVKEGAPFVSSGITYVYEYEYKITYHDGKEYARYKTGRKRLYNLNVGSVDLGENYSSGNMTAFATGGEASFTGPAWLDGSKKRPERVLSGVQTELFNRMVQALELNPKNISNDGSIHIGNINITTSQLNTKTDFGRAGREFAKELKVALATSGIGVNTKK